MEGDTNLVNLHIIGGSMLAGFFIILGIVCIQGLRGTMPTEAYKERRKVTQLLGFALLVGGISRGVDVLALWINYSLLSAILKNITGYLLLATLAYLPFVISRIRNIRAVQDISKSLDKTKSKILKIEELNKKLIERSE